MKLTKEFLLMQNACQEGIDFSVENNIIDMDYSDAIKKFIKLEKKDFAGWLIYQKSTENFVKNNGSEYKMGNYQVFNPLTGKHTECQSEEEALKVAIEITKEMLNYHKISIVQSISNENGDVAWVATNLADKIKVS